VDWLKKNTVWFLFGFIGLVPITVFFNQVLFKLINGNSSPFFDHLMFYVTQLGDGYTGTLLCLWLALKYPKAGVVGLTALVIGMILVQPLKSFFDFPRPATVFDQVHVVGEILHHKSFPSGHSATVMSVAYVCASVCKPSVRWIVLGIALITGFSRVYIGAHFPMDVSVGLFLGWAAVVLSLYILDITKFFWINVESRLSRKVLAYLLLLGSLSCILGYRVEGDHFFYITIGLLFSFSALYQLYVMRGEKLSSQP